MNVILALVLHNCTVSSCNQVEAFYADAEEEQDKGSQGSNSCSDDEGEETKASDQNRERRDDEASAEAEGTDSKPEGGRADSGKESMHSPSKVADIVKDLSNLVRLVKHDATEYSKSRPGSVYPAKIPVSSLVLSFLYLIQSPLPLALSAKRAQQVREQAEQLRHGARPKSRSRHGRSSKVDPSRPGGVAATKRDIPEILRHQLKTLRAIFNNSTDENLSKTYLVNSLLFFCLLSVATDLRDGEALPSELAYLVKKQPL